MDDNFELHPERGTTGGRSDVHGIDIARRVEFGSAQVQAAEPGSAHRPTREHFDRVGLPKIGAADLNVDVLASGLQHRGALLVRGLLTARSVDALRAFAVDTSSMRPQGREDHDERRSTMVEVLVRSYEERGLISLATTYLGERPVGMTQRTIVKKNRRGEPGLPWHQDGSFFGGRCDALNFWTALTPCGDLCPGLAVIPRRMSDLVNRASRELRPVPVVEAEVARLSSETPEAAPALAPGDTMIFDEMTLHRTSARPWKVPERDVAITWMFAPSRFPGDQTPLALTT